MTFEEALAQVPPGAALVRLEQRMPWRQPTPPAWFAAVMSDDRSYGWSTADTVAEAILGAVRAHAEARQRNFIYGIIQEKAATGQISVADLVASL